LNSWQKRDYEVSPSGSQIDLESITRESLFEHYKQMMQEEVSLYVVGNVSQSDLEGPLSHFQFNHSRKEHEFSGHYTINSRPLQKVVEEQQINQSRLLFGYETGVYHDSPDHDAMVVFNTMLGGMATSSLFMTIREQLSLAYQIGSHVLL
jgi:predicted Zn-dependent peptidase